MKMKKFINEPENLTEELLEGMALANPEMLKIEDNHLVVNRKLETADRVTIVTMGGSGHEPCCSGFVGEGMIDISVIGDIFAAPGPQACAEALRRADRGKGVVYIVLNHKPIALRCSAGSTVLSDDVTSETIGVDIEDVIRMNASAMAVQTFLGTPDEKETITNLCRTIDVGIKYGIPTLGVVAVGKQMARSPQFFSLATRVLAELGAQIVKTYYCDDFEKVTAGCPVPIVVAGGKQLPPNEALTLAYRAISEGAHGVDMGRNIFQAEDPKAMAKVVAKVIHENYTDKEAYEFYLDIKR